MSVEDAGAGERGTECETYIYRERERERNYVFFTYLLLFQMYLLEPMCLRNIFIFILCILMNNKDYLIWLTCWLTIFCGCSMFRDPNPDFTTACLRLGAFSGIKSERVLEQVCDGSGRVRGRGGWVGGRGGNRSSPKTRAFVVANAACTERTRTRNLYFPRIVV